MIWANFLHLYQPLDQQPDILEAVAKQSYFPLMKGLKEHTTAKVTLNVTGSLLELFDRCGYQSLIDDLKQLGLDGRVEFTGSAKYHAFLPMMPEPEIVRQIQINNDTLRHYLGDAYKPRGFFPPEMGYKPELAPILEKEGFEWVLLDEIALNGGTSLVDYSNTYRIKDTKLKVYFRERRLSNAIMSAVVRTKESLLQMLQDDMHKERYFVTAMDGETFGHHRPGLENLLFDIFNSDEFKLVTISEIPQYFPKEQEIQPIASTWASSKQDIENNIQFLSWNDPENEIHAWQWELQHLVMNEVYSIDKNAPYYEKLRQCLDKSLASDHFWWASAKPWWSVEMIEEGAYNLLDTLKIIPDLPKERQHEAFHLYQQIISTAFNWQRTGKIRQMAKSQNTITRIPFKDRTIGAGGAEQGVYFAFIDMMKEQEKKARENREYEKAILWRDAIFKLENKLDIYDAINAIDLLRMEIPYEEVEKTIEQYKAKYQQIRGGQPEQRGA